MQNIIDIIKEHSLTVRCLPYEVIEFRTYKEGDEHLKYVNSRGELMFDKVEVVEQIFDLDYFEKTKPQGWDEQKTPEERLNQYLKINPTGKRKLLKTTRTVKNGGWWYVEESKNTGSVVQFGKHSFFAPTLEYAIQLYLDSL